MSSYGSSDLPQVDELVADAPVTDLAVSMISHSGLAGHYQLPAGGYWDFIHLYAPVFPWGMVFSLSFNFIFSELEANDFFSCFPKCLYTTFENDLNSLFFPRLLLDTEGWWEGDWFDRGTMGRPDLKVEFSLSNLQQPVQKAQLYTFWQLASDGQDLISVGAVAPVFTLTSNQGPDWEGKPCPPAQPVGPSHCWQWPQLLRAHWIPLLLYLP